MRRRDFSASLLIASAAIQPLLAQTPEKRRTIAIVASFGKTENISEAGSGFWRTFFEELRRLGHVEGRDLIVADTPNRWAALSTAVCVAPIWVNCTPTYASLTIEGTASFSSSRRLPSQPRSSRPCRIHSKLGWSKAWPDQAGILLASVRMITDDELAQLPEDPELAFVEFERIIRARYYEAEHEQAETQYGDADSYRLEYINKVLAAARVFQISVLAQWQVPLVDDNIRNAFAQFTSDVDHFTTQIRIRHAPVNRQNSVGLDGNTKAKIHHHIEQIRKCIEGVELPEKKRDSLYNKLDRFALEVDRARTSLQAGMAVYIEVCDGIGQGFKKLEPVRKWIDSIAALLGRAKEVEDSLSPMLPRPEEPKQLEPPHARLAPPPKQRGGDLDDDIPF